jgi:hypothetical protein
VYYLSKLNKSTILFDGGDDLLGGHLFKVHLPAQECTFNIEQFINQPLRELKAQIDQSEFDTAIHELGLLPKQGIRLKYINKQQLDVFYYKEPHTQSILLIGFSEMNPGRYLVTLEGVLEYKEG